ncbi:MAG: PRC-barrel domain-containing protein [Chloroflexota bacterium]
MTEYRSGDDFTSSERVAVKSSPQRVVLRPVREQIVVSSSSQVTSQPSAAVRREHAADPVGLSTLKDMPVVSLADGTKVGTIKEVFFDTNRQRAVAFILASDTGESLLSFESIRSIGPDALTVESAGATQELRSLADLMDLKAVSSDGTLLGEVKELQIDRHDGRLTELMVHRGGMLGIGGTQQNVPAAAIRGMGPQLATVELSPSDK